MSAPAFDVEHREQGIFFYGESRHCEPMGGGGNVFRFQRGSARGDKDDTVKTGGFADLFSSAQVSEMNRVEGAAENTELQLFIP